MDPETAKGRNLPGQPYNLCRSRHSTALVLLLLLLLRRGPGRFRCGRLAELNDCASRQHVCEQQRWVAVVVGWVCRENLYARLCGSGEVLQPRPEITS